MILLPLFWWWLGLSGAGSNSLPDTDPTRDCEVLRMKCAYRSNCAKSLHAYMVDCADVLSGRTSRCPWACKRALISLTSHEIGFALANCDCGGNEFCQSSKERAEVCRPEVAHATADDTIVACSVAEWICAADPLCSTALEYYHRLCRSMFHGRKCTPRCNNSLNILERQDKASKLRHCYCDGSEDFPCHNIRENTRKLCYGHEEWWAEASPTTPQAESGGRRTIQPTWWLLSAYLLVLWTFKTWIEGENNSYPIKTKLTAQVDKKQSVYKKSHWRTALHFQVWPWWWTSECSIL